MRPTLSALLAAMLAAPPVNLAAAPINGTVEGVVTVAGRPVSGVVLALVDLNSGTVLHAKSGDAGAFRIQVAPGEYVIASRGQGGMTVGHAPTRLSVTAGSVASAQIDLVSLPVAAPSAPPAPEPVRVASLQEPQAPPATLPEAAPPAAEPGASEATPPGEVAINHDPVGCFLAGQFPLLDAKIDPLEKVARARVYFKSAIGSGDWFFIEMTQQEGQFLGKLPRPRLEASPVSYYIQATTTEFSETQTQETAAIVVLEAKDCPQDRKLAAIGPQGPIQVFSAATGAAITPAGFAAGGAALTAGAIALIGGAAAIGIGTAIIVTRPTPTPTPTPPIPTPTPTPTPSPSPSPSPSPTPVPSPPPSSPVR